MTHSFIRTLSNEAQGQIADELRIQGFNQEDIERALDSRLCDLEDVIDLKKFQLGDLRL